MNYTLSNVVDSIAGVLSHFGYEIYDSSMQQEVETPCFFISMMPSSSEMEIDSITRNELALDVVFLQRPNIEEAMENVYEIIEYLDENLDTFAYTDGTLLHTYERQYHMEKMDLHYQFKIKVRCRIDREVNLMQTLEGLNYEIKR